MGSIDIIKAQSTLLSSANNKYQQHQEKKLLGMPRMEPRAAAREASMIPLGVLLYYIDKLEKKKS